MRLRILSAFTLWISSHCSSTGSHGSLWSIGHRNVLEIQRIQQAFTQKLCCFILLILVSSVKSISWQAKRETLQAFSCIGFAADYRMLKAVTLHNNVYLWLRRIFEMQTSELIFHSHDMEDVTPRWTFWQLEMKSLVVLQYLHPYRVYFSIDRMIEHFITLVAVFWRLLNVFFKWPTVGRGADGTDTNTIFVRWKCYFPPHALCPLVVVCSPVCMFTRVGQNSDMRDTE